MLRLKKKKKNCAKLKETHFIFREELWCRRINLVFFIFFLEFFGV